MSFQDFVSAVEDSRVLSNEAPVFGDSKLSKGPSREVQTIQVRYFIARMSDTYDKCEAERIFTKSLQCQNNLNVPGDICVFKEESNFDKDGEYCVVIKYAEVVPEVSPSQNIETTVDVP
jgi:hypothetical protein